MADNSCDESNCSNVDLGFAEKCENNIYLSALFFPSKLGGRPAWLRWDSLPASDILKCGNCEKQRVLLCQIYVPHELSADSNETSKLTHRTIYLFCCRNGPCSKSNLFIKAFRAERLQTNEDELYEGYEKNVLNDLCKQKENQYSLCSLCGCLGIKTCSSCHNVKYCCKDHQTIDWKYRHKKECNNSVYSTGKKYYGTIALSITHALMEYSIRCVI